MINFSSFTYTQNTGKSIKLLQMNVLYKNTEYKRIIDYINEVDADIISLQEVNNLMENELNVLFDKYPTHLFDSRSDGFGIGVLSKIPFENIKIKKWGDLKFSSIVGDFVLNDKKIRFVSTHPMAPIGQKSIYDRNDQLLKISEDNNLRSKNLIIIGDLNTTPWSWIYKTFVKNLNLKNTRIFLWYPFTWPRDGFAFWIPIDHCLISKNLTTISTKRGKNIGSDHFPLICEVLI